MRINANEETQYWLKELIHQHTILPIPNDDAYDLKIFSSPQELEAAIRAKDKDQTAGISRLTATFDWEYKQKTPPKEDSYWMVKEDGWQMPWNLQLKENDKIQKRRNRHLSWAEQPHTIGEVGSTYTIQGFDLNYAGVIIGPSVKYRDGKVIFDRDGSRNKDVIRNRKLADGQMADVSSQLLNNELNVLLTRGVNGLYIYAVDDQLRQALLDAQEQRKKAQYDSH